ncbi:hypothetical protein BV22DRAFT_533278 [Leucogyrophana mollusca]|uniref:Uncharacterized protein n=1 Tax=Leucogyrophana mollusca TaxID=85980 RepID=A0ACB8BEI3_9AGAM|nr:hypothetical protein BV22DRAFT_533278 [Leucogyrophana mollusca]
MVQRQSISLPTKSSSIKWLNKRPHTQLPHHPPLRAEPSRQSQPLPTQRPAWMLRKGCIVVVYVLLVSALVGGGKATTNFTQCLSDARSRANSTGSTDLAGLLLSDGTPITTTAQIDDVTAVSYELCVRICGSGQEPFSWSTFSQEFSAWLLPYLALISQLPFGARHRLDNLMSAVLTVGSPVLAGYSMFLTLLNARWVSRSFEAISYPNSEFAVRVLSSLQQVPLRVTIEDCLLPSLVVLPENDEFWSEFADFLNYTHTWSISAATSILWVIIAFIFTVADSFSDGSTDIYSNGQGVGSVWLWLIPIVIGWLQLSPKCDYARLQAAVQRANNMAFVASYRGPVKASTISNKRAITIDAVDEDLSSPDEGRTPPVFNYARALSWAHATEKTLDVFRKASINASAHKPVSPTEEWIVVDKGDFIHPVNRTGSMDNVKDYCRQVHLTAIPSRWAPGIFFRMFLASLLPLALQWGTTGAAILALWFTPTTKLGCRSLSYLVYGALSTVVWMLLALSSILGHYSASCRPRESRYHVPVAVRMAKVLAQVLRWSGKALAIVNAIGIIASSIFQFSSFYDTCYCDGSVMGRGTSGAYVLLTETSLPNLGQMKAAWIGALCLASVCAMLFIGFVNLLYDAVST